MARFFPVVAFAAALALASTAMAESRPPILVTDPSARTYRAAIQEFAEFGPQRDAGRPVRLRRSLGDAIAFSGLFASVETQAFLGPKVTPSLDGSMPVCPNWRQIGADALLQGEVRATDEELSVEFRLLDVARGCVELLQKRYKGAKGDEARIARVIADDVVAAFTGTRGVADTEIAFVSNRSGAKEIYVMGAEGENVRRATRNRSINNFPDWAPDGRNIVYTSYREGARPWLYMLARGGKSPGRILRGLAGNAQLYRGVFDPKGKRLAVVVSQDGASELYVVGRDGGNPQRVTHHRAIDIAPTWSPDGRRLAFVSDRTGSPQVYLMDADGGTVRRLTFDGTYNTAPHWSPDGRWIAYETRVGGQFDIWIIDPEGTVNVPLITHPRSDESPSWSPDGRKLVFASTRRGRADLYSVDLSGENLRRLTKGEGDNTSPSWGPYRR
jgi:TolB protein